MKIKQYLGKTINGFTILNTYDIITENGGIARRITVRCEDCGRIFSRSSGADFDHIKCKCKVAYLNRPKVERYFIEWQGIKYTKKDFCRVNNIGVGVFTRRLEKGMTIEEALQKEIKKECPICHSMFLPKANYRKYCSPECAKKGLIIKRRERGIKERYHWIEWRGQRYTQTEFCKINSINVETFRSRINKGMTVEEAVKKEFKKECPICHKLFITAKPNVICCSSTCQNRRNHGKGEYKDRRFNCIVCGKEFIRNRDNAKTCSMRCSHAYCTAIRKGRYKKLQQEGHYDYSVTLEAVYEKYKGVCNICGKKLNFDCGKFSNDYPSMDHIIPLVKGGYHTWDNVQLACRGCNNKKGAK